MPYVFSFVRSLFNKFPLFILCSVFSSTSRLICRCRSQAIINTVAMMQIIPIINDQRKSIPNNAQPKSAAQIGSNEE